MSWKYLEMAKNGTKFKTKCGFQIKIYAASHDNACSGIHGAVLVPNHPATFGGWTSAEWRGDDGTDYGNNKNWDLEVEE